MDFAETFARAKAGDESAFLHLWESVRGIAIGCAVRHGRASPDELLDFLQEMAFRLWMKLRLYSPDRGSFPAWCHAVFRNLAIDICRKEARHRALRQEGDIVDLRDLPDSSARAYEERAFLRALLDGIRSPERREAVELRYLCGMSVREIQETTGCAESAVKSRVHRGVLELRRLAERTGLLEP